MGERGWRRERGEAEGGGGEDEQGGGVEAVERERRGRRTWTTWRESEETIFNKFCSMPPSRIDVASDCNTSFKSNEIFTLCRP